MNWYKTSEDEAPEITEEMTNWYKKRTENHINLVRKYCKKIHEVYGDRFDEILERAKIHDQSKYEDPEIIPYIFITWDYKCKDENVEFNIPEDIQDKMNEATEHHVKSNSHHPEYHSDQEETINREDRDKPPKELIDATSMPELDLVEMCADWSAMSEEKGGTPMEWADKNVNVRWKFTEDQVDLIYEVLNNIWE